MTDFKCECECHKGTNLYHVRWKPCCSRPIDGGELTTVWGCKMKDGSVEFLMARKKDEVAPFLKKELGLDPIEETVDIATAD
jgi:hypothetical protein